MKRWIVWLLILVLALSGCSLDDPKSTNGGTEPGNTTQQATTPPVSLYVKGSALEDKTNGALKVYAADSGEITGIESLDGDIVMFAYDGIKTTITRISGPEGLVKATTQRQGLIAPSDGSAGTGENKLAYFDAGENAIMMLDGTFHQVDQINMPEGAAGAPVLTSDLTSAFYCSGNEIRALNLVTGIPRLVCQLNLQELQIIGLLMNDTVLHCYVTDMDGNSYSAFYSAQTGEKIGRDDNLRTIASWDENYIVQRTDGSVREVLLGERSENLRSFAVSDTTNELYVLPGRGAIAGIDHGPAGVVLTVYEPSKGNALGSVTLEGIANTTVPMEDPNGKFVWFAVEDPDTEKDVLCCWDYTAVGSDQIQRLGIRYTAENPDITGLAQCEELAEEIAKKYYVNILLGDKPVEPEDYSFMAEYQVSAYQKALQALDAAMARFPENFFYVIGTSSENPKLQINLVRAIVPNRYDVPPADDGLQYWIREEAYMTLVVCDQIEQNFYHELCHAMDTYVYAHSPQYDYWKVSNPEGFEYDNSYSEYASHEDSPYLQGENRAFIDAYSMTYAHEDRATVFEYAMLDGCGEYFESEIMQEKLTLVCKAIRRAFGWRQYEGTFPWEQYLKESQAYVKEK